MPHPRTKLSTLLTDIIGGYWGEEADAGEVNVQVVRNGDLQHGSINFSKSPLRSVSEKQFDRASIKPTDLVITTSGDCGRVAYVDAVQYPCIASNFVKILRVDQSKVRPKFLYYFLISEEFESQLPSFIRGTTMPNLSMQLLIGKVLVPIPSIEEQTRIVAVLDKANEIKKSINNVTEVREHLMLSTFYEMFHSDSSLRSDWIAMNIEELAVQRKNSMRTGPFGSHLLHSEFVDEGIPVLGIDNVVDNVFKWKKERYITEEKYRSLERYTVFPGDLLITIMGTVGRTAVCPDDLPVCINTKHLACITLNRELVHPFFVSYSLRHDQEVLMQIQLKNRGAIMDGLNLTLIKSLKLAVPPIELQHQFVEIMNRILDLDEQLECVEHTTLSLSQELLS